MRRTQEKQEMEAVKLEMHWEAPAMMKNVVRNEIENNDVRTDR